MRSQKDCKHRFRKGRCIHCGINYFPEKCPWCGAKVDYVSVFWNDHYVLEARLVCDREDPSG